MPVAPGRVALLFHEGYGGGASISTLRVIPLLIERGWEPHAYVDRPGRLADTLESLGVKVEGRPRHVGFSVRWLRHPPGPAYKLRAMPGWFAGLGSWLRRTRPLIVHSNSLYSLPDAVLARSLGFPVYLQLLEMLPAGRKGAIARELIWKSGIRPGTVSTASAERFAGGGRMPEIVRSGTPFPQELADRRVPGRPVVGTVGWVCERKGTDVFVEMARRVRARRPDVEFRIVGANADTPGHDWGEEVLRRAHDLGVVHIPETDVFTQLPEWDVFVLPARFDPYPLTVMEAMATGVPVVGSRVDGIVEQVVPGTGFLANSEDADDFAARVLELLSDDDRRSEMGSRARAHAREVFTLAKQAEDLEAAWLRTLGAR